MRAALVAALALALVSGCKPATGAFAFVTVDVDPSAGDVEIYQIRSVAENGADSNEALFPPAVAERLSFPKSYVIELGARTGELRLRVEGLAADGVQVLVRAIPPPVEIRPGEQLSVPVRLKRACAATTYCKDVPGAEWLRLVSTDGASKAGAALAAAPLSGGSGDDLIIGARERKTPNVDAQGEVYVVFNDPLPGETLSLQSGSVDVLVRMQQCPAPCGDGFCDRPTEDADKCPADCSGACVEDGDCAADETCTSCPADCGYCGSYELDGRRCGASTLGSTVLAAPLGTGGSHDLIIASVASSAVYVLHGPFPPPAGATLDVALGDRASAAVPYTLIKGPADSGFGYSVAVGDVLGPGGQPDGKPDLVIGAQRYSPDGLRPRAGAVFVVPNELLGGGVIDLESSVAGVAVVVGPSKDETLGAAVAVGDVIGSGAADLVIGAPSASPVVGGEARTSAGAVYVVAGPLVAGIRDLASGPADLVIQGAVANDTLGVAVAVGDLTGDGVADVALGAPAAASVYVLAGPLHAGDPRDLAGVSEYQSLVQNGGLRFGAAVVVEDVSGDGIADLLVGAPGSATQPGRLIVVRGGASLPAVVDFDDRPTEVPGADIVITGVADDELGTAVVAVDPAVGAAGAREILVGAPKAAAAFYVLRAE